MEFNFAGGLADIINQSKRKLEDEANADADVSLTWWQCQYCWQVYMVPLFRWLLQFGKKRKNRKDIFPWSPRAPSSTCALSHGLHVRTSTL